jgi:fatty acid desaturase
MLVDQTPAPDTHRDANRALSQEEKLAKARQQVAAIKAFYLHLFVFAAVVALLAVINATTGGPWWVLWVLFGWGIGILAHWLFVIALGSRFVADWEERKTRELADRM